MRYSLSIVLSFLQIEEKCLLLFIRTLPRSSAPSWLGTQKIRFWDLSYTLSCATVEKPYSTWLANYTVDYSNTCPGLDSIIVVLVLADQLCGYCEHRIGEDILRRTITLSEKHIPYSEVSFRKKLTTCRMISSITGGFKNDFDTIIDGLCSVARRCD